MKQISVRVVPPQSHWLVFGGFELQMRDATAALASEKALDISVVQLWSESDKPDLLHVWGLEPSHWNSLYWARRVGVKTVMTALFPYLGLDVLANVARTTLTAVGRIKRALLNLVDHLVVVNEAQAEYVAAIYGYSRDRMSVIPNIIAEIYFQSSIQPYAAGPTNYVLNVGSVCRRKNQLSLVRACSRSGLPLVLVGRTLPGEEGYGDAIESEIRSLPSVTWIRGLPAASSELVSLYKGATYFALVSTAECQPISLLEAAALNLPMVISRRPFVKDFLSETTACVSPSSVRSIASGLQKLRDMPKRATRVPELVMQCRASKVVAAYLRVYRGLVEKC